MIGETEQSIKRQQFIDLAKTISSDPLDRVPSTVHSLLDPSLPKETNKAFIDVHAHSFTLSHVPENFIKGLKFLSREYKKKILLWVQKHLAKYLGQENAITILNKLAEQYQEVFAKEGISPTIFIVNLMMDMQRGIHGGLHKSYLDQLTELIDIRNKTALNSGINYSNQLLPFLAVDPNNPEIFEQFLSVFDKTQNLTPSKKLDDMMPFVGVKLYPPLGYQPSDPVLMDIFEVCQAKNIPILTHVGGYRTKTEFEEFKLGNRTYNADGTFTDRYKAVKIQDKVNVKSLLIQPMLWKPVLEQFPKLKVCFAHMGDKDEWSDFRNKPASFVNHVWQTLELIKNPAFNAYADISYSFTTKRNVKVIKEWMNDPVISKKLMYGSDFYLTEVEKRRTKESFEFLIKTMGSSNESWRKLSYDNACDFLFKETV